MAIYRLTLLFLLLTWQLSFGVGSVDFGKEEWILTRRPSTLSWIKILSKVPELELVKQFGPRERYALVRAKSKIKKTLPKEIVALQRNYSYQAFEIKDPDFGKSWGLSNTGQVIPEFGAGSSGIDVGAVQSWDLEDKKNRSVLAILDTGIDLNHEDLRTSLWLNKLETEGNLIDDDRNGYINDLNGWNFVGENNNVLDDNNHGTAVAGVIAADANNGKGSRGVTTSSDLMIVKILDVNGSGTTERAIRGIEYAVRNGASVINASWGGGTFDQALFDTVKWAGEQGVLVVCAAGNDSKDNDSDSRPAYPASFQLSNVVSVAAHDPKGALALFSNYGKETVHLAAPGLGIYAPIIGGYHFVSGTSFAAPFVSAVGSLLKAREPNLSPAAIRDRIISTTLPMHYYVKEKLVSGGRLHSFNAIKNIVSPKPQFPSEWKRVSKTIESAHPYLNNQKQVFEISQPGASHLRVHFSKFDLEAQYDFVSLRDKDGLEAMSYSGPQESFWSADVLGDTLRIEFVSDFSNSNWGFGIDAFEFSSDEK